MENKKWYENMFMLNRDPDWDSHWLWEKCDRDDSTKEACEKGIEEIFGGYRNPLTDVALCLFCGVALFPTDKHLWGGRMFPLYRYNDGAGWRWKRLNMIYEDYKLDHVQMFIDQTKKHNIRPWATFRMNDCHPSKTPTALKVEAIEGGMVVGNEYGYYRHCFDFSYPNYRNALRDVIKDAVDRYDWFGVELDFTREPYCFDYKNNPDCHKIMTEYVREIKEIVTNAEKRVGHKIQILIRVPATPSTCLEFGFDIKTMAEEGLIDAVNPSPRWAHSDSGIPIKEWHELVNYKIPVLAGIEQMNVDFTVTSLEMIKGYIAAFYGQGADGISLYNYFNSYTPPSAWDISKDVALEGKRQFVVTDQDCFAYPENRYKPLPLEISGKVELPLEVGLIKANDSACVIIDFEGDAMPTLTVNGKEIAGVKCDPVERRITGKQEYLNLTPHNPLSFDISGIETPSSLDLTFSGNGTVNYVEVVIDAK